MVISFMLHWTGDIIHDAYLEAITTPLSLIGGSVEKPDKERVFVAALSENIQRINY